MNLYFTYPNSMHICLKKNGIYISPRHICTHFIVHHRIQGDVKTPLKHPQVTQDSAPPKPLKPVSPSSLSFLWSQFKYHHLRAMILTDHPGHFSSFPPLLFSITSAVFIYFIFYSHHHHLQFSCWFIYLRVVCFPDSKWSRDPVLLTNRRVFPKYLNRTHPI